MNSFFYLIITILVEFIVYIIAIRKKAISLLEYCILINLVTWPLANIFYSSFGMFWIIEISVFIIESILIKYLLNINWRKAIIISFIANLITALIGLII
jgi:hypothetical protein